MIDKFSTPEYFNSLNRYFRAANYLSAAQLYLLDNPLLRTPLKRKEIKQKIVGHWGTVPGQNFVWTHCNRVINKFDLNMMFISGPGHGGNFFVANSYLEGGYSEVYPEVSLDIEGLEILCRQFSFPKGVSSHASPEVPGSIHEGGELGYSLAHAYGAVLDNPDLIVTAVVGDGEAETGPLATSWHANKFLNPKTDGNVLPVLHLNGYKISNPTVLARLPRKDLLALFSGYGYEPVIVEGSDPNKLHRDMAKAFDWAIKTILHRKTSKNPGKNPMIILSTPKGWTGPKVVNEKQIEGTFRAHQVPITINNAQDVEELESWLRSYHPEELFDENARIQPDIQAISPKGNRRMSMNPHANGGNLLQPLTLPDPADYCVNFKKPGAVKTQDMLELGAYIRDVFKLNKDNKNYRIFSPDEAMSNRLYHAFEATERTFNAEIRPNDEFLSPTGRIMDSYLSEHLCEGMLEGYLLTGRHGMFDSYEAFIRVVDSMVSQHAKWLKMSSELPWRKQISSLNLILTSNVWQQDHNGFTHQEPGFLDHLSSKTAEFVRMYLPPDANTLLYTFDHMCRDLNRVNVVVASKHPSLQWLTKTQAKFYVEAGLGVWDFACLGDKDNPDVIVACAGDTATLEAVATVSLIREHLPTLNVRFVNIIDLMKLVSPEHHPHGLDDATYDAIFTKNKPIIFNFHGYPRLIHQLTYKRKNDNLHVSGYCEEGTITTPFDMRVLNKTDRFHLLEKVAKYCPAVNKTTKTKISKWVATKLAEHNEYIKANGVDMPEITEFKW